MAKPVAFSRKLALISLMLAAVVGMIYLSSRPHDMISTIHGLPTADATNHPAGTGIEAARLPGPAIAAKLGNETIKAELGRAAWKLFHTTMARFPDEPTSDESSMLKDYIYLFQRLYPCGECADHFGQLLKKYPPQVSSRSAAAVWGCHVHNEVNKSLKKDIFDCSKIGDFYDCGCADDEEEVNTQGKGKSLDLAEKKAKSSKPEMSAEAKEKYKANGRDFDTDLLTGARPLKLEKEGLMRGG